MKGPLRSCSRLLPKNPTNPATPECMAVTFQQSSQKTTSVTIQGDGEDKPVTNSSGLVANPSVGTFSGTFT